MTISSHNVGQFERTFHACERDCPGLRIQDLHINVAQRSSHYYGNQDTEGLAPPLAETLDEVSRYRRLRGHPRSPSAWVESRYLHHLDGYLRTGSTPMPCHALRSSCF